MRLKNDVYFWLSFLFLASNFCLIIYIYINHYHINHYHINLDSSFWGSLFGAIITGGIAILIWYSQKRKDMNEKENLKNNIESVFLDAHEDAEDFLKLVEEMKRPRDELSTEIAILNHKNIIKTTRKIYINNEHLQSLDVQMIISGIVKEKKLNYLLNYKYFYNDFVTTLKLIKCHEHGIVFGEKVDFSKIKKILNENIKK